MTEHCEMLMGRVETLVSLCRLLDYANFLITGSESSLLLVSVAPLEIVRKVSYVLSADNVASPRPCER